LKIYNLFLNELRKKSNLNLYKMPCGTACCCTKVKKGNVGKPVWLFNNTYVRTGMGFRYSPICKTKCVPKSK